MELVSQLFGDGSEAAVVRRRLAQVAVARVVAHHQLRQVVDRVEVTVGRLGLDQVSPVDLDQQFLEAGDERRQDPLDDVDAELGGLRLAGRPITGQNVDQYLLSDLSDLIASCLNLQRRKRMI